MTSTLRVGLIGVGGIGQAHAQAFADCAEARLVSVADPRREAAESVAASSGCQAFPDLDSLLRGPVLDAAIVCVPPAFHFQVVEKLLNAGLHVLCEKPFAMNLEEGRRMIAIAEQRGRLLTMASKYRYGDDVVRGKELLAAGILGEIVLYENVFTGTVDMRGRWNSDRRLSGGGVLMDNGAHSADLMRFLLGPITAVSATAGPNVQGLEVEESVVLLARTATGVLARVDLSWSIAEPLDYHTRVHGTAGTMTFGWKESQYRLKVGGEAISLGVGYRKIGALRAQLVNFARAIAGTEPLLISAADAIASVAVIEAGYAALKSGCWASVEPIP